jgi:putative DNA primase/helicase
MTHESDQGGAQLEDLERLSEANTATDADSLPDVLIQSEGEPALSLRPCYWVFDQWADKPATEGGASAQRRRPGVWFFGIKAGRGDAPPAPVESFVCAPLTVEAVTTDSNGVNFGRLLRLRNTLGRWVQWAMPMEMLAGTGDTLRAELLAMGLEIDIRGGRDHLPRYLTWEAPRRRVLCVQSTG